MTVIESLSGVDYLELTRFSVDETGGTALMPVIPSGGAAAVSTAYSGIVQSWTVM